MEAFLNQIIPIIITAIVGILVALIKAIGDAVVSLIEVKKKEVIAKIGIDKYNSEKKLALDIFNIVEEHFRLSETVGNVMNEKIEMFDKLIKEKIPSITNDQIITLRQSIAGEVNRGKEVITK